MGLSPTYSAKDRPLIELGVGENFELHHDFFMNVLGVSDYLAVERRPVESEEVVTADILEYLSEFKGSANIVAFGVFNEPMSPDLGFVRMAYTKQDIHHGHVEHEYLRRTAKEISRILPKDGVFFGDGLHPFFRSDHTQVRYIKDVFENYLWSYGVSPQEGLEPPLSLIRNRHMGDMFFLEKNLGW